MAANWAATYRLQVHKDFTLDAAGRILPYLADLGISHVYLSPCLQAAPGSMHGYDVTDPSRISEDLGGEQAWERFVEGARRNNLGILIDIVPNHMSASMRIFSISNCPCITHSGCISACWRTPMARLCRRAN